MPGAASGDDAALSPMSHSSNSPSIREVESKPLDDDAVSDEGDVDDRNPEDGVAVVGETKAPVSDNPEIVLAGVDPGTKENHNDKGGEKDDAEEDGDTQNNGDEEYDSNEEDDGDDESRDNDSVESEDDEPKLKIHKLTSSLPSLYRHRETTSACLVSGDKMIVGSHNGLITVLSLLSLQSPIVSYKPHDEAVTSFSVSPYPIPFPNHAPDPSKPPSDPPKLYADQRLLVPPSPTSIRSNTSPRTPRKPNQPSSLPNSPDVVYIGSSSLDGRVFIASLLQPTKDFVVRNFERPVNALALSPNYRSDRNYISGGLNGDLVLTTGGRVGYEEKASVGPMSTATKWLTLGLVNSTATDKVLHSGEGTISTIKWSLSGKFIAWANELGVKLMRSDIRLADEHHKYAWSRIAHVDCPSRPGWKDMATVWRARIEWIKESDLEDDDPDYQPQTNSIAASTALSQSANASSSSQSQSLASKRPFEKLAVGWGDHIWILHVKPEYKSTSRRVPQVKDPTADIVHQMRFDDCLVAGISLYTPSLVVMLAYLTKDDDNPIALDKKGTPHRGVTHGVSPELRLIDMATNEEISVEKVEVSQASRLTARDYHLNSTFVPSVQAKAMASRSAFEALGDFWDASLNAGINVSLNATRLLSSAASVRSVTGGIESAVRSLSPHPSFIPSSRYPPPTTLNTTAAPFTLPSRHVSAVPPHIDAPPAIKSAGLKIFVHSPFDCSLAIKRTLADRFAWLIERERYKDAFYLAQDNENVLPVASDSDDPSADAQSTPTKSSTQSLRDFLGDAVSLNSYSSPPNRRNTLVEIERRKVGELWLQQLFDKQDWSTASEVAPQILGMSVRWEPWVLKFIAANRYDEITSVIPITQTTPSLSYKVYDQILIHYLETDYLRFGQLVESWASNLYDKGEMIKEIQERLKRGEPREDTTEGGTQGRDWRILINALAKLNLELGRHTETLKCYIQLQNSDAALNLIAEFNLIPAVSHDIPGFLTLRILKRELAGASLDTIRQASGDAVHLLVNEALTGTVKPSDVISQLTRQGKLFRPFMFLYLQALWNRGLDNKDSRSGRFNQLLESHEGLEGKLLVEQNGDLAVSLFADYDRKLLENFIKFSTSYDYSKAIEICESKEYYDELVHILSQTGQTQKAMNLIINSLDDFAKAIQFATTQNDPDLWETLVRYSLNKPRFLTGLLERACTFVDPTALIKRIPKGLEIEGVKTAITNLLREHEIQYSISNGATRVMHGENAAHLQSLREGRDRGIKFIGYLSAKMKAIPATVKPQDGELAATEVPDGHCVICGRVFGIYDVIISFPCCHAHHLSCIANTLSDSRLKQNAETLIKNLTKSSTTQSIGAKVAHAHNVKPIVANGCHKCIAAETNPD